MTRTEIVKQVFVEVAKTSIKTGVLCTLGWTGAVGGLLGIDYLVKRRH